MEDNETAILKGRLQFYQEEIQRMKRTFEALWIMPSDNAVPLTPSSVLQSYNCTLEGEELHKESHVDEIKEVTRTYKELNEKLSKEIDMYKTFLEKGEQQVNHSKSNHETIMMLQKEVERYEGNLTLMEKKCPWLEDPTFNLINLQKEVENLKTLRLTRDKLVEELAKYDDLKPDLKEASQQLAELKRTAKENYRSYMNSFDN